MYLHVYGQAVRALEGCEDVRMGQAIRTLKYADDLVLQGKIDILTEIGRCSEWK
jgi:hypothetical protein